MALRPALIIVFVSLITLNSSLSTRIAGFSGASSGSHYFSIRKVMEELASRGNEVVLVKPVRYGEPPNTEQKIPHMIFHVPYDQVYFEEYIVKTSMEEGMLKTMLNLAKMQTNMCEFLLNNTEVIQHLKNFDLIVFESIFTCPLTVGDLLGIPKVVIISGGPNSPEALFQYKVPCPVSYVPSVFTSFTSEMSFPQRLVNFGVHNFYHLVVSLVFGTRDHALREKYIPGAAEIDYYGGIGNVDLVLLLADFAIEYPQPLLPGHIMVGAITAKSETNPLPSDLADSIYSAGGHGFVIASFGSYAETIISKEKIDVLGAAFGKLKQKVIWKLSLKGYIPSFLSPNIKVVSWMPQNDLLAHKDIKAFVSHVGHSSHYESAYHGVPVVAVPLCADQFFNAKKIEHFGLGISVDHQTATADEVVKAIELVMNESRFKDTAMRISRLMKDSPRTPLEKTGDWIEYVVRHGGARHLRAQVFNIPWYQYYLLDVIAFLVAIVTLVVMVIRLTCRCLCRVCCRPSSNKSKRE